MWPLLPQTYFDGPRHEWFAWAHLVFGIVRAPFLMIRIYDFVNAINFPVPYISRFYKGWKKGKHAPNKRIIHIFFCNNLLSIRICQVSIGYLRWVRIRLATHVRLHGWRDMGPNYILMSLGSISCNFEICFVSVSVLSHTLYTAPMKVDGNGTDSS